MRKILFALLIILPSVSMGMSLVDVYVKNDSGVPLKATIDKIECISSYDIECSNDTISPNSQCKIKVEQSTKGKCWFSTTHVKFKLKLYYGSAEAGEYYFSLYPLKHSHDYCKADQAYTPYKPFRFWGSCKSNNQISTTIDYTPLIVKVANTDLPQPLKYHSVTGDGSFDPDPSTVPTIAEGHSQSFTYFPLSWVKQVTMTYDIGSGANQQCVWQFGWQDSQCKVKQINQPSSLLSCDVDSKLAAGYLCYFTLSVKQGPGYVNKVSVTIDNQIYDDLAGKWVSGPYPDVKPPAAVADGMTAPQFSYKVSEEHTGDPEVFVYALTNSTKEAPVACLLSIGKDSPCDVTACQVGVNNCGEKLKKAPSTLIDCGVSYKKEGQTCDATLTVGLKKNTTLTPEQARELAKIAK